MAAGFGGPVVLFSPFSSASVLGAPRMTAWLGEEQGIAVGTGFGVLTGDWVGFFNITTHPDYRRRGCGKGLLETRLQYPPSPVRDGALLHRHPACPPPPTPRLSQRHKT